MLKLCSCLHELSFSALMEIYEEGNRENGAEFYPDLPECQGILRAEQDFLQYLQDVFFRTPNAVYAIWLENDRYVSALRLEPYRDGFLLCALETKPDERRKGYALQLIRDVQDWLHKRGQCVIYSHISKKNLPSIGTHERCGFQKIMDHAVYLDGSVTNRSITMYFEKK